MVPQIPVIDWQRVSAAFVDVDETLIADKSMRSFLNVAAEPLLGVDSDVAWEKVAVAGDTPGGREAANEVYYALFEGCTVRSLREAGASWFAGVDAPRYWIEPTVSLCRRATANDVPVVLVSGSHHACLDPIAARVGATDIICTELEVAMNGVVTGERFATAIGSAKADRVRSWAERTGIPLAQAIGIGDHASDADFLTVCDQVLAIGSSMELSASLTRRSYRRVSECADWSLWRVGTRGGTS